MRVPLILTLLFVAVCVSSPAEEKLVPGAQVACEVKVKVGGKETAIRYWQFVPKDYDGKKKFPLMLFLHGAGERGSSLEKVKKWGPPKLVRKKKDFPFVLISPQCPKGTWWKTEELYQLVKHAAGRLRIDPRRMYVTGLSMGGFGSWHLMDRYPGLFAAGVPICGGGKAASARNLVNTPIWAFHGDADGVVKAELSKLMIKAIEKAGGKKAKLTLYPGVGHNSWSRAYANEEVYKWLLSHKTSGSTKK
ncbi:MAG: dienelactone hydrolase family protein [Planctomycetota bacterium]|nr:dienelactone hydrolase family protein [Planctomycetota bacterium]